LEPIIGGVRLPSRKRSLTGPPLFQAGRGRCPHSQTSCVLGWSRTDCSDAEIPRSSPQACRGPFEISGVEAKAGKREQLRYSAVPNSQRPIHPRHFSQPRLIGPPLCSDKLAAPITRHCVDVKNGRRINSAAVRTWPTADDRLHCPSPCQT